MPSVIRVAYHLMKFYTKKELVDLLVHEMIHVEQRSNDPTVDTPDSLAVGGHNEYFRGRLEQLNAEFPELNVTV
jgi:hypothetical protein